MALFQHNSHSLGYTAVVSPFAFDLVLMGDGGSEDLAFWHALVSDLSESAPSAPSSGRIIVCEWSDLADKSAERSAVLARFFATLYLQAVHVVAVGKAAALVSELEKRDRNIFAKKLVLPAAVDDHELILKVREFCGLE